MVIRTFSVAFEGVDARYIEVQCAVNPGLPSFTIVGLPDKAVTEAKERVRAALSALQIALPSKKIIINLSPADLPKAGSHFDLPIALALLTATGLIPADTAETTLSLGELALDGSLIGVRGALPAALAASEKKLSLACPQACAQEAAWVGTTAVYGAKNLAQLLRHLSGKARIDPSTPGEVLPEKHQKDFQDVKGQERAKRALEIAAAGAHHMLMVGSPGSGKSMLASRLPTILPPLMAREALDTSLIHSVAGLIDEGGISRTRPFRAPHHTASMAAIAGGGRNAQPGEISLAHNGVLFLDELPEFNRQVLETLRQPLETSEIMIARANAHVTYPARFMLIAAANPCKCGYCNDPANANYKGIKCKEGYLDRISGPLMDRFDIRIDLPPADIQSLSLPASGDPSSLIRERVTRAREIQMKRNSQENLCNAHLEGRQLEDVAQVEAAGQEILQKAALKFGLSARGYHRVLRVARTIADLEGQEKIQRHHITEALSYRISTPELAQA